MQYRSVVDAEPGNTEDEAVESAEEQADLGKPQDSPTTPDTSAPDSENERAGPSADRNGTPEAPATDRLAEPSAPDVPVDPARTPSPSQPPTTGEPPATGDSSKTD